MGTGILKLITFGGFGVWWLIDLILVLAGAQRDKHGRPLAEYDAHKRIAWIVTGALIALSMIFSGLSGALRAIIPFASVEPAPVTSSETPAPAPTEDAPVETVQSWAANQFGTFATVNESGNGDGVVTLPAGATSAIVTATHDGSGSFEVSLMDAANATVGDPLVDTVGEYSGTTTYGINSPAEGTSVKVTAGGDWTITISPVSEAPTLASTGAGDAVFLYPGDAGMFTATHDGSSNFVISEVTGPTTPSSPLVNEIGEYSGEVALSAGPSVIQVVADGNWTLQVS